MMRDHWSGLHGRSVISTFSRESIMRHFASVALVAAVTGMFLTSCDTENRQGPNAIAYAPTAANAKPVAAPTPAPAAPAAPPPAAPPRPPPPPAPPRPAPPAAPAAPATSGGAFGATPAPAKPADSAKL